METKRNRRRGSALIMVLGILSVLLLMAVAFSSFVRTERSGSTNLKNGVVARSSLYTAVGRVMDAIDLSFDSPEDDSPVAVWPHPWLASDGSVTNDYFQSSRLGENETAGAHVLLSEMVPYLSPAQLALARSARCNWAPILGSVNASRARGTTDGALQGLAGRPTGDDLLGRYAFIVLDTTGLASVNLTGGGTKTGRTESSVTNTQTFVIPTSAKTSNGLSVEPFVSNPSAIKGGRMYASLAQARDKASAAFDETTSPTSTGDSEGTWFPADLFASFSPSLAELDPEGNPKIVLPTREKLSGYAKKDLTFLVRRAFRAMVGIFARGRVSAGEGATNYRADQIPIFSGSNKGYGLSRSALATVALMDGLDADIVAGQSANPALNYWAVLPSVSLKVNGATVEEERPDFNGNGNSLNYPCTESAPLVSSVYAYIEINPTASESKSGDDTSLWRKTYTGTLNVGACAVLQNRTQTSSPHKAKIKVEWAVMSDKPEGNTSSGARNTKNVQENLVEWKEAGDDFGGGGEAKIDWGDFFSLSGSQTSPLQTVDDGSEGERFVIVQDSKPITIQCAWNPNASGGSGGGGGDFGGGGGGGGGGDDFGNDPGPSNDDFGGGGDDFGGGGGGTAGDWYPPVHYAADGGTGDVFVPVRIKVTVYDEGGNEIQQAPAPALGNDWWIRVDAGLWHGPDSTYGNQSAGFASAKGHSVGWAFCVAPAFAFDTTGLAMVGDGDTPSGTPQMHFWINDVIARSMSGGIDDFGNPLPGQSAGLMKQFFTGNDPHDTAISEVGASAFGMNAGTVWNYAQQCWLFNAGDDFSNVTDWMITPLASSPFRPDMLHSAKAGDTPFIGTQTVTIDGEKYPNSERLGAELSSRIPANGYETVADLGTVMCGPYETLSLFKTFRLKSGRADFHPVVDYFSFDEDRYPTRQQILAHTQTDGEVKWDELSGAGTPANPYKDLYSAAHDGRVNLNAPPLVKCTKVKSEGNKKTGIRGDASRYLNPYPILTVLNQAPYTCQNQTKNLDAGVAELLASEICRSIENADGDVDELWGESHRWSTNNVVDRPVVRNLSILGRGAGNDNPFLRIFANSADPKPYCDYEREGILRGIVDGFSTRGQTYLAIIRADAYSPKFGENASVEDGTTLATTHAIVEFFRDPMPARAPDGSLPADSSGNPVVYHNWYIRSFRVF